MSKQEVVVSEGWWLTRNGLIFPIVRSSSPRSYNGTSQPWVSVTAYLCCWSGDGRYMPPIDNSFDLVEKLDPSDSRVLAYEDEHGKPVTVPEPAEPAITRAIRPDCTWTPDDDYAKGHYYTTCLNDFEAGQGTPTENGMVFCCFCGGKLIEREMEQ